MVTEKALDQKEKKLEEKIIKLEKREKELSEKLESADKLQKKLKKEANQFKKEFAERTLKLVTSGFGLVAALAWNELIKELIKTYIQPVFGKDSGLISLIIYAVVVTALAVFITYQLGKFTDSKED